MEKFSVLVGPMTNDECLELFVRYMPRDTTEGQLAHLLDPNNFLYLKVIRHENDPNSSDDRKPEPLYRRLQRIRACLNRRNARGSSRQGEVSRNEAYGNTSHHRNLSQSGNNDDPITESSTSDGGSSPSTSNYLSDDETRPNTTRMRPSSVNHFSTYQSVYIHTFPNPVNRPEDLGFQYIGNAIIRNFLEDTVHTIALVRNPYPDRNLEPTFILNGTHLVHLGRTRTLFMYSNGTMIGRPGFFIPIPQICNVYFRHLTTTVADHQKVKIQKICASVPHSQCRNDYRRKITTIEECNSCHCPLYTQPQRRMNLAEYGVRDFFLLSHRPNRNYQNQATSTSKIDEEKPTDEDKENSPKKSEGNDGEPKDKGKGKRRKHKPEEEKSQSDEDSGSPKKDEAEEDKGKDATK